MDFGSLVQTKSNPKWDICPLTVRGIMKTNQKNFPKSEYRSPKSESKEPGRFVGSVYIPNRIFRGRIVEQLRDEHEGLSAEDIGARISVDWSPAAHRKWLDGLLEKLRAERMIEKRGAVFVLAE